MHQRSELVRVWLTGAIGLSLITGCLPTPNRVAPSLVAAAREGTVKSNLPVNVVGNRPATSPGQLPQAMASPVLPPTIISNNGGSIISHNGGNIISHNGGNLRIPQVALAFTTVRLKDAAGNAVKDDKGQDLVTKTDAQGNYSFPVDVKGRNLVIEADVEGQSGKLKSLLPKDGLQAGGTLDVDLTSTLTLAYILNQYVKGDLATFERLPRDIEQKARVVTEETIVEKKIELPKSLDEGAIVAKVDEVRKADQDVDQVFEEIKKLLVIAGIVNEGDGQRATDVDPGVIGGVTTDAAGNIYVFSQQLHTLWKITPEGTLRTLVAKGNWGYPEQETGWLTPGYTSGLVRDSAGNLILADTYNNRVVRIDANNKVEVIAGTGVAGYGGDGGDAKLAQFNRPSGVTINKVGTIFISDTDNHRVRKIDSDGKIVTLVGDGTPGFSGDGSNSTTARVNRPQGLITHSSGDIYISDFGNNRIRVLSSTMVISTYLKSESQIHSPIALGLFGGDVVCVSHQSGKVFVLNEEGCTELKIGPNSGTGFEGLYFPRSIAAFGSQLLADSNSKVLTSISENGTVSNIMGVLSMTVPEGPQIYGAYKIVVDKDEIAYVADMGAKKILKVSGQGIISTLVGNGFDANLGADGSAEQFGIGNVAGIDLAEDGGLLFTSIGKFTAVRHFTSNGRLENIMGNGKVSYTKEPIGVAKDVELPNAYEVIQMRDGTVVASFPENNYLLRLNKEGMLEHYISPSNIKNPDGLCLDRSGNLMFVEEGAGLVSLIAFGFKGTVFTQADVSPYLSLKDVRGIACDAEGVVYLAGPSIVIKVDRGTPPQLVAGQGAPYLNETSRDEGLENICDITLSPAGNLYILETKQIKKITAEQLDRIR